MCVVSLHFSHIPLEYPERTDMLDACQSTRVNSVHASWTRLAKPANYKVIQGCRFKKTCSALTTCLHGITTRCMLACNVLPVNQSQFSSFVLQVAAIGCSF